MKIHAFPSLFARSANGHLAYSQHPVIEQRVAILTWIDRKRARGVTRDAACRIIGIGNSRYDRWKQRVKQGGVERHARTSARLHLHSPPPPSVPTLRESRGSNASLLNTSKRVAHDTSSPRRSSPFSSPNVTESTPAAAPLDASSQPSRDAASSTPSAPPANAREHVDAQYSAPTQAAKRIAIKPTNQDSTFRSTHCTNAATPAAPACT